MEWSMTPVFDHLSSKQSENDMELLTALVAAMSDPANLPALDRFPEWREL